MAASLLRCRLIFYLLSVFLHAEVLFQHVDGGDIKLIMRVRPATTPRRHQARGLPSGDHSTVEILRHSPPAAADAGLLERGSTRPAWCRRPRRRLESAVARCAARRRRRG
jgi:hypothetical protein